MREIPLTALKAGIDRLRIRGGAKADSLYDFVNAFRSAAGTPRPRPGTARDVNLIPGTVGMTAFDGCLHVFSSTPVNVGSTYTLPVGAADGVVLYNTPVEINGGIMFVAAIYVVATGLLFLEFDQDITGLITTITVEHDSGTQTLLVADGTEDVTPLFGAYALFWSLDDTWTDGEEYDVAFDPPAVCVENDVLLHPTDPTAEVVKIHFAAPFQGALYVVAEFDDGGIYHYWLQEADAWEADTEYSANQFVRQTTDNGYVYRATRYGNPYPAWAPGVPRTAGNGSSIEPSRIEPTVYNEYYYEVTDTDGDNPISGQVEPDWPTVTGQTIIENSDGIDPSDPNVVTPPAPPAPNKPQPGSQSKYLR